MKKTVFLLTVLTALTLQCNAQLLWKISGNGAEKPSYIFGSHHFAPALIIDELNVRNYIAAPDETFGEISLDEFNRASTDLSLMQAMTAPADSTLDKIFTPEEYEEINKAFQVLSGMPGVSIISQLNGFKPVMISNLLTLMAVQKAYPEMDPQQQIDKTLLSYAASLGKVPKGLETLADQIKTLYGAPIARQAADLLKAVRSEENGVSDLRRLTEAYLAQDIDAIYTLMTDPATGMNPEETARLLDDRNNAWVAFLLGILPTTSMFIVVGAGHLPGENGVLNQLRGHGYEVSPVTSSGSK